MLIVDTFTNYNHPIDKGECMSDMEENLIKLTEASNPDLANAFRVICKLKDQIEQKDKEIELGKAQLQAHLNSFGETLESANKEITKLTARNTVLEKLAGAAKKHISFNSAQYIHDKECGNLVDRNPDTVALLEALQNLEVSGDE